MPAWWPRRGQQQAVRQHQQERVHGRILLARAEVVVDRLEGVLQRYERLLDRASAGPQSRDRGEG